MSDQANVRASTVPDVVRVPTADAALIAGYNTLATVAQSFEIDSRDMYEFAAAELASNKANFNAIEEERVKMKAPVLEAGRAIDGFFKPILAAYEQFDRIVKGKMVAFDKAERQRREEEERRARAVADAERKRLEREALERAAEEQNRLREEAQALAEALASEGKADDAEQVLQQAEQQAADRADEVLTEAAAQAQTVVAFVPPPAPTKVAGLAGRENWKAECTDLDALIKAAADGNTAARECLMANDKVIASKARMLKNQLTIPGIRVWNERGLAVRASSR